MARHALIVLAGVALSLAMVIASSWVVLNFTPLGRFVKEYRLPEQASTVERQNVTREYGDPFQLMQDALLTVDFVAMPLAALAVGVLTGWFAKARHRLLTLIALLPLSIFVLLLHSYSLYGIGLCLTYVALSLFACILTLKAKSNTQRLA